VLNNHDIGRSASRLCRGDLRRARVLAALVLTQRGTPFLYYGEEIGMCDGRIRRKELRDPVGIRYWPLHPGRDPERTPMQWDDSTNAGFSEATELWLPVNSDYERTNVALQQTQSASMLSWYKALLRLRRQHTSISHGEIAFVDSHRDVLAYSRTGTDAPEIVAALNFSGKPRPVPAAAANMPVILSSQWQDYSSDSRSVGGPGRESEASRVIDSALLAPYEARIVVL
jgi:alpha-glucosidase